MIADHIHVLVTNFVLVSDRRGEDRLTGPALCGSEPDASTSDSLSLREGNGMILLFSSPVFALFSQRSNCAGKSLLSIERSTLFDLAARAWGAN